MKPLEVQGGKRGNQNVAHKHPKKVLRVDPELANDLSAIAKLQGRMPYEAAEEAVREWIEKHRVEAARLLMRKQPADKI